MSPQQPTGASDDGTPVVTQDIAAEAAVWIARLHGPDRSPAMERECRAWQARSAAHRLAFERCTDTWQDVGRVTLGDAFATMKAQRAREATPRRPGWVIPTMVAASLTVCALGINFWRNLGVYSTGVGEQRVVLLDDGSRLSLNTHSRVHVHMDARRRSLEVEEGEALFEVAKDPQRPFVVQAGGSEVVAHGTVFSVRLVADRAEGSPALAVTLLEGKVTVQADASDAGAGLAPSAPIEMLPGDRVRLDRPTAGSAARVSQRVDRPRLEGVTAWKRNEVSFDDTALIDAVAEMNRYDRTQVVLVGTPALGQLRVSGDYRTGDTAGFAHAVATLHGLVIQEHAGRLELSNPP